MTSAEKGLKRFYDLTEPLLADPAVTRSTMMGLPCVRIDGAFFASCDRSDGNLLAKLPKEVVEQKIAAGTGEPFSPAGRRFKEWVAIPLARSRSWPRVLADALEHVRTAVPAR